MLPAAGDPPFFAAVDQVAGAGIQAKFPRLGQSTLATWNSCSRAARAPRIAHSAAGRLAQCWSGVMMKSFAIAAAAALSGPIIGVAVFFAANSDHSNREGASLTVAGPWSTPNTKSAQPDIIKTFAVQDSFLARSWNPAHEATEFGSCDAAAAPSHSPGPRRDAS